MSLQARPLRVRIDWTPDGSSTQGLVVGMPLPNEGARQSQAWFQSLEATSVVSDQDLPYSPAPPGYVVYVVGDVHGRVDLLQDLHRRIDRDRERQPHLKALEVYLGDYIDRGAQSAAVIDCLIRRATATGTVYLRGNHEAAIESYLAGTIDFRRWMNVGGLETVASYGVEVGAPRSLREDSLDTAFRASIPPAHRLFLATLRDTFVLGPYLFVHAGIRPGIPLCHQSAGDLLWIRIEFLEHEGDFGHVVVHGHTPVEAPEFRPNRINLDTGAYATGRLTCLRIGPTGVGILRAEKD